ncbi:MAG TPA: EI24 domain-containing protein [Azospira sp.]|nr:EI24 domain-containing protein [Azospira sp.]
MAEMLLALVRSFHTLSRRRVWWLVLSPAVAALGVWLVLTFVLLDQLSAWFLQQPPMTWLSGWGALWLAKLLAAAGGWLVILALSYLTAMVLAAVFIMPILLQVVAARDYPEVAAMGRDSFFAGAWNSLWAALLFIGGWLLTLPLWLIPGLGLVLPMFWMAWLNRKTFAYDSLAMHATPDEWRLIRERRAMPLLGLGILLALLAHVPVLGLLAPAFGALLYIHFGLESLRQLRGGAVVTVDAVVVEESPNLLR